MIVWGKIETNIFYSTTAIIITNYPYDFMVMVNSVIIDMGVIVGILITGDDIDIPGFSYCCHHILT